MRRRRMVVAFQSVQTPLDRVTKMALDNASADELLADARRPPGKGRYWCAADKPMEDAYLVIAPVYRTSEVPDDEWGNPVQCEECGIEISKLQEMFA